MSIVSHFIAELIDLEEAELSELERIVRAARHRRPNHAVSGRFDGAYFLNADGEFEVAKQMLLIGQPSIAALIFLGASGNPTVGPVGSVQSSDPNVTAVLSDDGQSVTAEIVSGLTAGPATLTWHDTRDPASLPAGQSLVPDFSVEVDDTADTGGSDAEPAVSGAFGDFKPASA